MDLLENIGYITLFIQQISTIFVMSTGLLVILTSDVRNPNQNGSVVTSKSYFFLDCLVSWIFHFIYVNNTISIKLYIWNNR